MRNAHGICSLSPALAALIDSRGLLQVAGVAS